MKLIYNALLNQQTVEHITWMSKDYPYFLEITPDFPFGSFNEWLSANLPLYSSVCESCMGGTHLRQSHCYCVVIKNGDVKNGWFLGFPNEDDRKKVAEMFKDYVRNPEPFKTEL